METSIQIDLALESDEGCMSVVALGFTEGFDYVIHRRGLFESQSSLNQ